MLTTDNHDRDAAGFLYVYPVVSRRAGGLSIGINLNPNNACNWQCLYCQVPNLSRGVAPTIDLPRLQHELNSMLNQVVHGDFMRKHLAEEDRYLRDLAISGNGEPTSCRQFHQACERICDARKQFLLDQPVRLITNGSYLHRNDVQQGLQHLAAHGGEIWVKMDAADSSAIQRVNGVKLTTARLKKQVVTATALCPTWIQTCLFAYDGKPPAEKELSYYLHTLQQLIKETTIRGVMLYGVARPSMQPESARIAKLSHAWLESFAERIRALNLHVRVN